MCLPSPMPMPVPMPRCCTLLRLFWPTPNAHAISVPVPMFMRSWLVATYSCFSFLLLKEQGGLTIPPPIPMLANAHAHVHALLVAGHPLHSALFSLGKGGEHAHAPAL